MKFIKVYVVVTQDYNALGVFLTEDEAEKFLFAYEKEDPDVGELKLYIIVEEV